MPDQRIHPRVDVTLDVQYQPVQDFQTASSVNISIGGIYICTSRPLPRDYEILLRFALPGVATPLRIIGLVVWSNPGTGRSPFPAGMGIKFLNVTDGDAKLIADYVAKAQAQGQASPPAPEQAAAPRAPVSLAAGVGGAGVRMAPAEPASAAALPSAAKPPAASPQEPPGRVAMPPAPEAVTASSLGIVVEMTPAEPAQAAGLPSAAKPPAAPSQESPDTAAAPPPGAPETEIPDHIRRQMEYMISLQAASGGAEPTRPAPPAGKAAAPSPPGQPPRATEPRQPGPSSTSPRPPQKPGEKKP